MDLPVLLNFDATIEETRAMVETCARLFAESRDPLAAFCLFQILWVHQESITAEQFRSWGALESAESYAETCFEAFLRRAQDSQSAEGARWVALFYQAGWHPVTQNDERYRHWLGVAAGLGDRFAAAELAGSSGQG